MSESSNICLSCGLCCNGTVIGFVQLDNEELPVLKEIMDIEDESGNGFFLQPCNKYCDGCTIYSKRPKQCASFECGLLKSVDQKQLDFDSAVEIVDEVNQRKIAIEEKLAALQFDLQSPSFYFKMAELRNLLHKKASESPLTKNYSDLLSDLNQFDSLLTSKFGVSLF
jgi:uncharacterized protein